MRAVVVSGVRDVAVEEVPDAQLEAATDVLLRVTSSAVCGTASAGTRFGLYAIASPLT